MFDFCLTFPYAALLALGGVAGYVAKGSVASLGGGLGSAILLAICGTLSLQYYKKGKLCKPATLVSLVVAVGLGYMMYNRYQTTGKFMPAGIVAYLSGAMSLFYAWSLLMGPLPSKALTD